MIGLFATLTRDSARRFLTVNSLVDLMECNLESLTCRYDTRNIIACDSSVYITHSGLQVILLLCGELITQLSDALFSLVCYAVCQIAFLNLYSPMLFLACISLSFTYHTVNLLFREATRCNHSHFLSTSRAFITRLYMQNVIGINVKGDFELGCAIRSGQNTIENKASQRTIVFSRFALTLQHINFDRW